MISASSDVLTFQHFGTVDGENFLDSESGAIAEPVGNVDISQKHNNATRLDSELVGWHSTGCLRVDVFDRFPQTHNTVIRFEQRLASGQESFRSTEECPH